MPWAGLQLPLTAAGLLAGWGLLRHTELAKTVASSALLPGGAAGDTWVRAPWQVLAAAQPAIAEEAWARVFLIALLYVLLRRAASSRAALVGAIIIAGYWFAWLHAYELTISALITTVAAGTLFSLPLTFLWLRRGLEAAIAFHFVIDGARFAFAYLANVGPV